MLANAFRSRTWSQPLTTTRQRLETALTLLLLAGLGVGFVLFGRWLGWPVVDDAGIALAYGRSFFAGDGFRLTPASQPVEGFSSPLWTLVQGLSLPLRLDGESFSSWAGLAVGAASLPLFALWGPCARGRPLRLDDLVAPALITTNASLVAWCSSGMETPLWLFAHAASGAAILGAWRTGRTRLAALLLGGLVLVRPEAPIFVAAVVPLWLVAALRSRRPVWKEALAVTGPVLLVGLGLLGLRWYVFADILPNTYWAKRFWSLNELGYVTPFLTAHSRVLLAALAGLLAGSLWRRLAIPEGGLALAWAGAALLFARNGDWMGEWRFAVPAVPFLAVAAGLGVQATREAMLAPRASCWRRIPAGATLLLVLGVVGAGIGEQLERRATVKATPQFPLSFVRDEFSGLAPRLAEAGELRPLLGFPDMGGQAWVLRSAELIDVAGLCDRAMARHANNYPALDDYLASEGPPSWIDVHGPSGHLRGLPKLIAQMDPVGGPLLRLRGLSAGEDPRCPGGKAAVLALSAAEQVKALLDDLGREDGATAIRRWRCAWAYQPEERLPPPAHRRALAQVAWKSSRTLEEMGKLEPALRLASFSTIVSGQDPHFRSRTEALRARLFPRAPP